MSEPTMTLFEAAAFLGVLPSQLLNRIADGDLSARRGDRGLEIGVRELLLVECAATPGNIAGRFRLVSTG